MTETATEAPVLSAEDKAKLFSELPDYLQTAVRELNEAIAEHNAKVNSILSAESKDPKLIKAEIFEQNPDNNEKLSVLRKRELKLIEQLEKIRDEAYKVIEDDGLMPKEVSPEEVEKLKAETVKSHSELKTKAATLVQMEDMVPMFKGKLAILADDIKNRRGTGAKSSSTGEIKRPRFKRIEVNGVIEDDKGNKVYTVDDKGDPKFTFSGVVAYLKKQHKGIKVVAKDLTDTYFGDKGSQDELPETVTFTVPYTFKTEGGNETTVNYEIKATK